MTLVFASVGTPFHSMRFSGLCGGVMVSATKHRNAWRSGCLDAVQRQIAKLRAELPGTIVGTVKDAQKRRAI